MAAWQCVCCVNLDSSIIFAENLISSHLLGYYLWNVLVFMWINHLQLLIFRDQGIDCIFCSKYISWPFLMWHPGIFFF